MMLLDKCNHDAELHPTSSEGTYQIKKKSVGFDMHYDYIENVSALVKTSKQRYNNVGEGNEDKSSLPLVNSDISGVDV